MGGLGPSLGVARLRTPSERGYGGTGIAAQLTSESVQIPGPHARILGFGLSGDFRTAVHVQGFFGFLMVAGIRFQ